MKVIELCSVGAVGLLIPHLQNRDWSGSYNLISGPRPHHKPHYWYCAILLNAHHKSRWLDAVGDCRFGKLYSDNIYAYVISQALPPGGLNMHP